MPVCAFKLFFELVIVVLFQLQPQPPPPTPEPPEAASLLVKICSSKRCSSGSLFIVIAGLASAPFSQAWGSLMLEQPPSSNTHSATKNSDSGLRNMRRVMGVL